MLASKTSVRAFTAQRASVAPKRVTVIAMAKPVKAKDLRALSDEELTNQVVDLKKELASTRFLQRTRGVAEMNPKEQQQQQPDPENTPKANMNKHLRQQIAVSLTILRERQAAAGMDKRDVRKAERKALVAAGAAL